MNPHRVNVEEHCTAPELMAEIETKGREADAALALLRTLMENQAVGESAIESAVPQA